MVQYMVHFAAFGLQQVCRTKFTVLEGYPKSSKLKPMVLGYLHFNVNHERYDPNRALPGKCSMDPMLPQRPFEDVLVHLMKRHLGWIQLTLCGQIPAMGGAGVGRWLKHAQTTISKENRVDYQHRYCTLSLSLCFLLRLSLSRSISRFFEFHEKNFDLGAVLTWCCFSVNVTGRERFLVAVGLRHNAKYLREQFISALEVTIVLMRTQTPCTRPNEGWLIKFLIPKSVFYHSKMIGT